MRLLDDGTLVVCLLADGNALTGREPLVLLWHEDAPPEVIELDRKAKAALIGLVLPPRDIRFGERGEDEIVAALRTPPVYRSRQHLALAGVRHEHEGTVGRWFEQLQRELAARGLGDRVLKWATSRTTTDVGLLVALADDKRLDEAAELLRRLADAQSRAHGTGARVRIDPQNLALLPDGRTAGEPMAFDDPQIVGVIDHYLRQAKKRVREADARVAAETRSSPEPPRRRVRRSAWAILGLVALLGAGAIVAALASGGDRRAERRPEPDVFATAERGADAKVTFTCRKQAECTGAAYPVLNRFVGGGAIQQDERDFLGAQGIGAWGDGSTVWRGEPWIRQDDQHFLIQVPLHNAADATRPDAARLTARDVRVHLRLPAEPSTSPRIRVAVSAANTRPRAVQDDLRFRSLEAVRLAIVPGSGTLEGKNEPEMVSLAGLTDGTGVRVGDVRPGRVELRYLTFRVRAEVAYGARPAALAHARKALDRPAVRPARIEERRGRISCDPRCSVPARPMLNERERDPRWGDQTQWVRAFNRVLFSELGQEIWEDAVFVRPGDLVTVQAFVHNNAGPRGARGRSVRDTRISFLLPRAATQHLDVRAFLRYRLFEGEPPLNVPSDSVQLRSDQLFRARPARQPVLLLTGGSSHELPKTLIRLAGELPGRPARIGFDAPDGVIGPDERVRVQFNLEILPP